MYAQTTTFTVQKQFTLNTTTMIEHSECGFQNVLHRVTAFMNKRDDFISRQNNVNEVFLHNGKRITPLDLKVKRGFELFLKTDQATTGSVTVSEVTVAVALDLARLARLA